ncbi:MAG: hypothetical protein QOH49_474 [Acidobacteriota bacterium]|jgi:uncharacterized protein YjbI with pentapeptide repeats|nr:hypothetical protein [Acidobacteriota bacterium]
MANPEHAKILMQGVAAWNEWKRDNPQIKPDLNGEDLNGAILSEANLSGAGLRAAALRGANLKGANLREADLNSADLYKADLAEANFSKAVLSRANLLEADLTWSFLSRADLRKADLRGAHLIQANLSEADLSEAILYQANLRGANLRGANLGWAILIWTNLSAANLSGVYVGGATTGMTTLADTDLSSVKGLEAVKHGGPSTLGIDTLHISRGNIPELFLRGCGLSDWQIETAKLHRTELSNKEITDILYRIHDLRASQFIQINPLFISYTHTDGTFVDEMENYLNRKGIRFWRDVHHAAAGRLETQIDRAIRLNPTVLLILSEQSVQSDWVQHEARLARKLEIETKRDVLCPVALDDSWKTCEWPERLREQIMEYNILDFSAWRDEDNFRRMFGRLLDGLDLFYK